MSKRRKRLIENTVYEGGFRPGNIVVVTAPDHVKGKQLGAILEIQKWCPDGIPVYISHDTMPYVCIRTERGDTIISAKG